MIDMVNRSKVLSREVAISLMERDENRDIYDIIHNLEEFIESFGIKVFYSNMDGFEVPSLISGYSIVNKNGAPEIVINANEPLPRQRFTMAHEFGHIIMHWNWLDNRSKGLNKDKYEILFRKSPLGNDYSDIKEIQANEFASELLLPHKLLKDIIGDTKELKKNPIILEEIKKRVAVAFNVSESFANVQLLKIIQGEFD
ncbi:ImmA/IrrE family metallo-endopeptidase [Staphylococcus chromogenes]|uniref:ImmA/IrrE family metallo-endopeptidase n=1 Tax=Staphylococcus chromogenes TaxID=46126 RepID=UPI000D19F3B8|nr:ImmA/IrrE family metallo-endopeptidase [Staphylococcus chromogenes]PTF65079.1 toxin-antitoxin system toxin subunit [Staphylococcus chromogenes]PTF91837.1 toxin-antitoxin system toxin subunit [Staphylococcus chromogenes]PTG73421.1 toxin-antitoxin system toxin subunit [Staphylococcus chromogenes]RIM01137.1 ImmA/IrrE family metallo-endopeptidase [Staphylococcus chromogenes]TJY14051.1 ImmA/IrrE family metallo-endopeptidase [Staphylococcus chromogenes]